MTKHVYPNLNQNMDVEDPMSCDDKSDTQLGLMEKIRTIIERKISSLKEGGISSNEACQVLLSEMLVLSKTHLNTFVKNSRDLDLNTFSYFSSYCMFGKEDIHTIRLLSRFNPVEAVFALLIRNELKSMDSNEDIYQKVYEVIKRIDTGEPEENEKENNKKGIQRKKIQKANTSSAARSSKKRFRDDGDQNTKKRKKIKVFNSSMQL
eukprot:TRINITY_DN12457_c0_g1_i1.p1 TRINITY_DN12457_c0_g1~~TRINITY_DN12457_c0_g1_i1.p1  ORF type:complete len:217 (-),score=47.97 TRINITY_DN12457_c0_g1_i1:48-668(-)